MLARLMQLEFPHHAFGSLDIKNAFGTADRWQAVRSLQKRAPMTTAAMLAMYRHGSMRAHIYPSTPHHHQIWISEGVMQGDQGSAPTFAAGITDAVDEALGMFARVAPPRDHAADVGHAVP